MVIFRSRAGLWLIRLAILVPGVLMTGFLVFEFGGCTIGLTHQGTCARIPIWLGEIGIAAALTGLMLSFYVTPLVFLLGVVLEYFARSKPR